MLAADRPRLVDAAGNFIKHAYDVAERQVPAGSDGVKMNTEFRARGTVVIALIRERFRFGALGGPRTGALHRFGSGQAVEPGNAHRLHVFAVDVAPSPAVAPATAPAGASTS